MNFQSQFEVFFTEALEGLNPPKILDFSDADNQIKFIVEGSPKSVNRALDALTHGGPILKDARGEWIQIQTTVTSVAGGTRGAFHGHLYPSPY